jgi:hypothetical protein
MQGAKIKPSYEDLGELEATISSRAEQLSQWLVQNGHWCLETRFDLDGDRAERAFWTHGYMIALQDILQLMRSAHARAH